MFFYNFLDMLIGVNNIPVELQFLVPLVSIILSIWLVVWVVFLLPTRILRVITGG